jgi:hypothetical protein
MPYKSLAQERYFNANRGKMEAQGVDVDEWNQATKGRHLPMRTQHVDLGKKGSFGVKKGALHEMLHIPDGKKIPASDLAAKPGDSPLLRRRKASAKGFRAMKHG